jgi:hypothetical protein
MKKSKGPCWTGYTMVGMKSKEGLSVRPYDPRDKKQKKITDKQNPISEYDPKTKKLKYTAAKDGSSINAGGMSALGRIEKAGMVRGGGVAIKGLNFKGVF